MNGFCSGKCNQFPLCTLILCLPIVKAALSSAMLTGLLSFGAFVNLFGKVFFIILDKLITWDYFFIGS